MNCQPDYDESCFSVEIYPVAPTVCVLNDCYVRSVFLRPVDGKHRSAIPLLVLAPPTMRLKAQSARKTLSCRGKDF